MATPYMRPNSCVRDKLTGEVYVLLEGTKPDSVKLKVVPFSLWSRHALLCAWEKNWEQNYMGFCSRLPQPIEEVREERKSYEAIVNVTDVLPKGWIDFRIEDWPT